MMSGFVLKRILSVLPVLFSVTFFVFLTVYLSPGDPVSNILGQQATPENVAELRKEFGLDEPFLMQYFLWLSHIVKGDLGDSIIMRVPVMDVLMKNFKNTLILTLGSLIICVGLGVVIGVLSGLKPSSWFDRISMFLAQLGASVPVFWLGIVLMWIFSLQLGWLPSSGMYDMRNEGSFFSLLEHMLLPSVATAIVSLAVIARLTRSSLMDVMNADYIKTFRSYGMPASLIIRRHVFRNMLSPVINITGLQIGHLLGGVLFVEMVFSWPGIGTLLYQAITAHDIPMIQAGVLFVAFSFVLVNLITDLVVDMLNPRMSG